LLRAGIGQRGLRLLRPGFAFGQLALEEFIRRRLLPGGEPKIAQELGGFEQLVLQKGPAFEPLGPDPGERSGFFHLIQRLDLPVLFQQERHAGVEDFLGPGGASVQSGELGGAERGAEAGEVGAAGFFEIAGVNPGVDAAAGGIAVGIVTHPAMVMAGRVQRLAGIACEVAHDAHDVDDVGLGVGDFLRRPAVFLEGLEIGKGGLELPVVLGEAPRQHADQLAGVVGVLAGIGRGEPLGAGLSRDRQVGHEIVAKHRQGLRLQPVKFQLLDVEVMVGVVKMFERQVGGVAPAVGLAGEEGDPLACGGRADERREIGGEGGKRQLVDNAVDGVVPRQGVGGGEPQARQAGGDTRERSVLVQHLRRLTSPVRG